MCSLSRYFVNREIRSDEVVWERISMVDAERRLLANALKDLENQQFALLSDSCVPLRSFEYIYNYLMYNNVSYVDCFDDPGQHGSGRHMNHMLPEIPKKDFRKGAQCFTMRRQHAVATMADNLYYSKFRDYCGVSLYLFYKGIIASRDHDYAFWCEFKIQRVINMEFREAELMGLNWNSTRIRGDCWSENEIDVISNLGICGGQWLLLPYISFQA